MGVGLWGRGGWSSCALIGHVIEYDVTDGEV